MTMKRKVAEHLQGAPSAKCIVASVQAIDGFEWLTRVDSSYALDHPLVKAHPERFTASDEMPVATAPLRDVRPKPRKTVADVSVSYLIRCRDADCDWSGEMDVGGDAATAAARQAGHCHVVEP